MAEELAGWLAGSARFREYAEVHRDKIRKKVRSAADTEALRDVRAELQGARLLLTDPRIELAFEAYGAGKRGPITEKLQKEFFALVEGKSADRHGWLAPVSHPVAQPVGTR